MNYEAACDYLDGFVNYEKTAPLAATRKSFSLERIYELAERLGHPQDAYPIIHVAGSKGKGSTCAFAASMLQAAGLKVGLYISPHLTDLRERISINGCWIEPDAFAELLTQMQPHLEEMRARPAGTRRPTYFEIFTHLAFLHFKREKVDLAVIEVGMGGRLDATNIVKPTVCGICNISLEHTAILGDTLAKIASEKAGILKPEIPAFSAPQHPEAAAAIREAAKQVAAPISFSGKDFKFAYKGLDPEFELPSATLQITTNAASPTYELKAGLGLLGSFQAENWALAVRLAQTAYEKIRGEALSLEAIRRGSQQVQWAGRMELLQVWPIATEATFANAQKAPVALLDGAHTPYSLQRILQEIEATFYERKPLVVLFGCARDKQVVELLKLLQYANAFPVFLPCGNPRALSGKELSGIWNEQTNSAAAFAENLPDALQLARQYLESDSLLVVTGSFYLVGQFKRWLIDNDNT